MKAKKSSRSLTVLVADDHQIIRRALKSLISELWPSVEIIHAPTFEQMLKGVEKQPDLIIIDVNLPGGQNTGTIGQVKLIQPNAKILVFSSLNENIYAVPYLKAGASGYLTKTSDESEIVVAITTILAGGRYSSRNVKESLLDSIISSKTDDPFIRLSDRELQVAELLIKGIGVQGISDKLNLQMATVSTYKLRMFGKLKIKSIIELSEKMNIYERK
ncbi:MULTISPECIES: response regulator transcription factor [Pedobacter]|uniref:response regulator transcription factor n=1 Tax=Pedobacter TaxID=84567 RepID=UPI002930F399|nr:MULTISPECIES: response regulator transcription factor [Pedobacter]